MRRNAASRRRRMTMADGSGSAGNASVKVPEYVAEVARTLLDRGFAAYVVGGAVRDCLLGRVPKDWDICTSARPAEVEAIFLGRAVPTGARYGTVTVLCGDERVEVTTFRTEGAYTDGRRPDNVEFSSDLKADLARRDFTVNAMAYDIERNEVVDYFQGLRDLRERTLRTVGDGRARFAEDALRMLRALRLAAELGFRVSPDAFEAIRANHEAISKVSWERIRDELSAIALAPLPGKAIELACASGLLEHILPELEACARLRPYPGPPAGLFSHILLTTNLIEPVLHLRLAALLHDVGKPLTLTVDAMWGVRFPNHEGVGAALARTALERLRYPGELTGKVVDLVRYHMFAYDPAMKDRGVRRLVSSLGLDTIRDLAKLREADRLATGAGPGPGANMSAFLARVDEVVSRGAVFTTRDLAVDGHDVMRVLGISEGPQVGKALAKLLDAVLEDPDLNRREKLIAMLEGMRGTPMPGDARA